MKPFTPKNPDFKKFVLEKMSQNHFMNFLGFTPTLIEVGQMEGVLPIKPEYRQQIGFLHGGVTATLGDLAAGFAAVTLIGSNQTLVTVEMKISYLNPGLGDLARAKGYVIKSGQKLIFSEAEIYSGEGENEILVAKAYGTYATIDRQ